jgi:hypothetical protein
MKRGALPCSSHSTHWHMTVLLAAAAALSLGWWGSALAEDESYAAALARRSMPTDEAGRRAECGWIRQEASICVWS